MPAGYSLRVQLFAPNAYNSSDRPIRCFRVVAAPDLTVSEFCEEASRIHEINYGTYVLCARSTATGPEADEVIAGHLR